MNAVVDFFSGSDRAVRAGVTARPDDPLRGEGRAQVARRVRENLQALLKRCESDDYIHEALESRRGRMIEDLPKLVSNAAGVQINPGSRVRHHDLALSHVLATPELVDFRLPGERVLVHRGAEESLRYIAKTPEFRVSDIPGMLGDDVKVALVGRLISSGFLVPVTGE